MPSIVGILLIFVAGWRVVTMLQRGRDPGDHGVACAGEAVKVGIHRYKSRTIRWISASFEIPGNLRFTFSRESGIDRLAKNFGIAREHQTRDLPFDGRVYIECEDPALHRALDRQRELRDRLSNLVASQKAYEIGTANGRLWFKSQGFGYDTTVSDQSLRPVIAEDFLPIVRELRTELAKVGAAPEEGRDVTPPSRRWFTAAVVTCFVAGALGLLVYRSHIDHQVVRVAIPQFVVGITVAVGGALLAALAMLLGATAFTHRVFLDVMLAAIPGAWLAASGGVVLVNQLADTGAARHVAISVEKTYSSNSRKSPIFYMAVGRWPDPRAEHEVQLNRQEYGVVATHSCLDALWHAGRLGDGWVENYQPTNPSACNEGVEK